MQFNRAARVLALSVVMWLGATQAWAFGTYNFMGQNAEHEKITRLAFANAGWGPISLTLLAGTNGSLGMVGAPDGLGGGLLFNAAAHCDGGDYFNSPGYPQSQLAAQDMLIMCRDYINANLNTAVAQAGGMVDSSGNPIASEVMFTSPNTPKYLYCDTSARAVTNARCRVLRAMGYALHASQDFYSHTNYSDTSDITEYFSVKNPPGLNRTGRAPFLDPRTPSEPLPQGLISGCFESLPEWFFCNDGFLGKARVKHSVLNKDEGNINVATGAITSPGTSRGKISSNFQHAVSGAIEDSADKWNWLSASIISTYGATRGNRIVCAIKSDSPMTC